MNAILRPVVTDRAVSAADFRGAMRHLIGGVSVITAGRGTEITGMTVTSVTSLSVDPPTLIVSINRDASSFPVLKRFGAFGVNVLNADQLEIAERFAGKGGLKGADRFAGVEWTTGISGAPLLVGTLAALDCEVEEIIERYSHGIVIGHVRDISRSVRDAALAYWHGQYVALDQDEDAAKLAEVSLSRRADPARTLIADLGRSSPGGAFPATNLRRSMCVSMKPRTLLRRS
jgi:flavin reductase (DIM6/NTAB) family NADH-FMN oxidoreductase RutF